MSGYERGLRELGAMFLAQSTECASALSEDTMEAVIAVGAFDGLHLGHRELVTAAMADAKDRGVACVAVTFDPDPDEVLCPDRLGQRLLCTKDREAGLRAWGVDDVCVLPFDHDLARLDPRAFVEGVLFSRVRPVAVHVGSNFRFGHRGEGDTRVLALLGDELGFDVVAHDLVHVEDAPVSSTRVRVLLGASELDAANHLLGRYHLVRGTVQHGRGEGTAFGFPTANIACDARSCLPREGVYACYVACDGMAWPAAANVGTPPTFDEDSDPAFLEANLLGFSGDLYGREVAVAFVKWLRASRPFSSLEELERTVLGNIAWVGEHLGNKPRSL